MNCAQHKSISTKKFHRIHKPTLQSSRKLSKAGRPFNTQQKLRTVHPSTGLLPESTHEPNSANTNEEEESLIHLSPKYSVEEILLRRGTIRAFVAPAKGTYKQASSKSLSERQKMISGLQFDPRDSKLSQARSRARTLGIQFAQTPVPYAAKDKRVYSSLLRQYLPNAHKSSYIISPLTCDYGFNIHIGQNTFINSGTTMLDVAPITIGANVYIGPNVDIYAVTHHQSYLQRRQGYTVGKPVTIGDDTWIGGRAIINPGITIGRRVVIGSGSVVTKDIPNDVFAAGNPAKVIKFFEYNSEENIAASAQNDYQLTKIGRGYTPGGKHADFSEDIINKEFCSTDDFPSEEFSSEEIQNPRNQTKKSDQIESSEHEQIQPSKHQHLMRERLESLGMQAV